MKKHHTIKVNFSLFLLFTQKSYSKQRKFFFIFFKTFPRFIFLFLLMNLFFHALINSTYHNCFVVHVLCIFCTTPSGKIFHLFVLNNFNIRNFLAGLTVSFWMKTMRREIFLIGKISGIYAWDILNSITNNTSSLSTKLLRSSHSKMLTKSRIFSKIFFIQHRKGKFS